MSENERENGRWSLKEREYVGDDGQIHHHTHVWMDEHAGESRSSNGRGSGGSQSSRESRPGSSGGSSGKSASGSQARGRGRSGGQKEDGGEERPAARKGRSILAAATLGMAAMAAVALVTRRREVSRELDIYPGRREEPARDRDRDRDDSERGMY